MYFYTYLTKLSEKPLLIPFSSIIINAVFIVLYFPSGRKYNFILHQLLDTDNQEVLAKGLCERIGIDGKFTYKAPGKETIDAADVAMPTHSEAIQAVLNALVDEKNGVISSMKEIEAVGHRVVHGGETFACSVKIDEKVMAALEECIPLAPLHNPANITGIKACEAVMGKDVPQVGVFDTAFPRPTPMLCPTSTMSRTRCAATASTAPATSMWLSGPPPCWASPWKS